MHAQPHILISCRGNSHIHSLFQEEFQRRHARVTLAAGTGPYAAALVANQAFEAMLLVCPPVYDFAAARWEIDTVNWQLLEARARSQNAATPTVAVVVAPDPETISRLQELGVSRVIDLADRPSVREIVTAVLGPTAVDDTAVS